MAHLSLRFAKAIVDSLSSSISRLSFGIFLKPAVSNDASVPRASKKPSLHLRRGLSIDRSHSNTYSARRSSRNASRSSHLTNGRRFILHLGKTASNHSSSFFLSQPYSDGFLSLSLARLASGFCPKIVRNARRFLSIIRVRRSFPTGDFNFAHCSRHTPIRSPCRLTVAALTPSFFAMLRNDRFCVPTRTSSCRRVHP